MSRDNELEDRRFSPFDEALDDVLCNIVFAVGVPHDAKHAHLVLSVWRGRRPDKWGWEEQVGVVSNRLGRDDMEQYANAHLATAR